MRQQGGSALSLVKRRLSAPVLLVISCVMDKWNMSLDGGGCELLVLPHTAASARNAAIAGLRISSTGR